MTKDDQRLSVMGEITRGEETLGSAELLLAAGKAADAVSRAYYAAFHYARALLLTLGEDPITHSGVERLLHRHWVRTGELSPEVARRFSKLQKMRIDADYAADFVFTLEGAAEEVEVAREFVREARRLLSTGGWLS